MRLVSPLLKRVIYPGISRSGYLRRRSTAGPVVLTYHGVLPASYRSLDSVIDANPVSISDFRQQIRFLNAHYHVISPCEFRAWCDGGHTLPDRSVLLSCDDGLRSCMDCMLPVLVEGKLSCLFFITGASLRSDSPMLWHELLYLAFAGAALPLRIRVDNPLFELSVNKRKQIAGAYWQTLVRLSQMPEEERESAICDIWLQLKFNHQGIVEDSGNRARFQVMNASELVQLAHAGMELGAHTSSHLVLAHMPEQSAIKEILENRAALQQLTGQSIWALAYPYGTAASATSREYQMAREAGFSCAFTNRAENSNSKFAMPRVHITRDMRISEFEAHVSGFHHSLQSIASRRTGAACI